MKIPQFQRGRVTVASHQRGFLVGHCALRRNVPSTNPCMTCHPAQVKGYGATGMARALSRAATQPNGEFLHAASGTRFAVSHASGGMRQRISRGGVSGEYTAAYVVGSGHRAFGYLVQIGNYLFQSPISYQTQEKAWIMAPGYEDHPAPDFNRPVGFECLLCHQGSLG
jgi:hypothetical protein